MRTLLIGVLCFGLLVPCAFAQDKEAFKNPEDAVSYSVGYQMGADLRKHNLAVNPDMIAAGVKDGLKGAEPKLSDAEMRLRLADLQKQMAEARQNLQKEQAGKNLQEGEAFLAENAKKEGVVTLPSGLQYQVLSEGQGDSPKATDTVRVNYRGTLIDGKEFDNSYARGSPAFFQVDRVIKGWTEALQLMKPGAKWKLFIPAKLAYGERGAGSRIPPNSALIFEVELVSIGTEGAQ